MQSKCQLTQSVLFVILLYVAMCLRNFVVIKNVKMPERKRTMATLLQMANQCTCRIAREGVVRVAGQRE